MAAFLRTEVNLADPLRESIMSGTDMYAGFAKTAEEEASKT